MEGMNPLDLSKFVRVTKFSWIGIQSKADFESLRTCLRLNALHLKTLNLNLIAWEKADELGFTDHSRFVGDGKRSKNFFATDTIGPEQNKPGLSFPSLESLSLSEVPFKSAINELHSAFDFSALRTLRLWNCSGALDLLERLIGSQQTIRLSSLEIVVHPEHATYMEDELASKFLQAFTGLEDLYLSLPALDWRLIADSAAGHISTLKRVVFHGRDIEVNDDLDYFEVCDGSVEWSAEMGALLVRANCDVVGIGNPPDFMVSTPMKFDTLQAESSPLTTPS
jgi:hypothetical protein